MIKLQYHENAVRIILFLPRIALCRAFLPRDRISVVFPTEYPLVRSDAITIHQNSCSTVSRKMDTNDQKRNRGKTVEDPGIMHGVKNGNAACFQYIVT